MVPAIGATYLLVILVVHRKRRSVLVNKRLLVLIPSNGEARKMNASKTRTMVFGRPGCGT